MRLNLAVGQMNRRCAGCRELVRSSVGVGPGELILEGRWGTFVDAELGQVVHRCHAGVARPGPKRSTPSGRTEVWNRRRRMGAAAPSGLVFRG